MKRTRRMMAHLVGRKRVSGRYIYWPYHAQ